MDKKLYSQRNQRNGEQSKDGETSLQWLRCIKMNNVWIRNNHKQCIKLQVINGANSFHIKQLRQVLNVNLRYVMILFIELKEKLLIYLVKNRWKLFRHVIRMNVDTHLPINRCYSISREVMSKRFVEDHS